MCIYHALPLLFQFHYGTIKSKLQEMQAAGYEIFQFHYGTIKSP